MNIDWSQLITRAMKDSRLAEEELAKASIAEKDWQLQEMAVIADQLIALEDEDPDAKPGTESQWRNYRTQVRNWRDGGNPDFPYLSKRPTRPGN